MAKKLLSISQCNIQRKSGASYVNVKFAQKQWNTLWPRVTFLLRWFSFQKKVSPHSYQLKRLQVSKKVFFPLKINYIVLQTYRQCNNLKIQKSYASSHFDEQEDQGCAWIPKLLNMLSGFVKAACSGFTGKQFDDCHENQHSVGSMHAWAKGTCLWNQAWTINEYRNAIRSCFLKKKIKHISLTFQTVNALATILHNLHWQKAQKIYKQSWMTGWNKSMRNPKITKGILKGLVCFKLYGR